MHNNIISIMKGIAIIGVVAGHAGVSQWTEAFVNQWHLATFFFVSGMCFKEKHLNTPLLYVKRRVASLYVPFVEFGIAFLLLHNIFYFLNFTGNEYSIGDMIKELFNLTIRLTSSEQLMGAMWFCPALLITTLIFFFALKLNTKPLIISKLQPIWGGVILPLSVFMTGYMAIQLHIKSPYCIWQYMVISIIIFMGYWFRCYIKMGKWNNIIYSVIAVLGFSLIVFCTNFGIMARLQPTSINNESLPALLLIPLIGGLSVFSLSALLNQTILSKILVYVGDHTFPIMALHFFAFKFINLVQIIFYGYKIEQLKNFPVISHGHSLIWSSMYIIAGVTLPLVLSYIYNILRK